jgi:hypothetical protein
MTLSRWLDIGNGERSAILEHPERVDGYQHLRVRPWPDGRFEYSVQGERRGFATTMAEAKTSAVSFAQSQF